MTKKQLTKLQKSTLILAQVKASQWCYVNTDNEFFFMGKKFVIDKSVEEYKVHNKAGSTYNYTNEAYMEEILVTLDRNDSLKFYNQNYDLINNDLVGVKG